MPKTRLDEAVCPACGSPGMDYTAEHIDLPYLGESLETMLRCDACGYRHADFILTEVHDPMRYSHPIETSDDMNVRVVRSASGTVRIPELGIDIEPGAASDAYITNIEGILVRVEAILDQLHRDTEDEATRGRIEALQETLMAMRTGGAPPATLVIEDPFGNSIILGDRASAHVMTAAEAARLQPGMHIMDQGPGAGAA